MLLLGTLTMSVHLYSNNVLKKLGNSLRVKV